MPYRVLVVEDERPARANIVRLLASEPRFEIVGEAVNGIEALRKLDALRPDLVILDVQIPAIDGFEVLEAAGCEREFAVIFSTAHDAYALRAFDAHAVDYLLKPYDRERFRRALDKACAQLSAHPRTLTDLTDLARQVSAERTRDRIVIKTEDGWLALPFEALLRVSAAGKYVVVYTTSGQHVVRDSLAALADRVDPNRFVRVHRSDIVRVDAVARLEPAEHGDGVLVLADGTTATLSRTYRKHFLTKFRPR
ncbi:MAG TPA: LytTR family DNA-binding domain-containing protein [Polyangiaceae bacterium]|nr:LytTR family DNA-binding domain-containing protein [Polyangiaceae bacterium]